MEPNEPIYEYVEIKNGLITRLSEETIQDYFANSEVKKIDLDGRTLFPGFIDSHSHWIGDKGNQQFTPEESIDLALSGGWTSISELFVNEDRLNELINLDTSNQLKLRVNAFLPLSFSEQRFGDWYKAYTPHAEMSEKVRIAGVKLFMDGGQFIGYANRNWWFTSDELNPLVKDAHDLGFQIAIHAITDNATDMALNALELAQGDNEDGNYRHRIEHAIMLRDDQINRLKEMNTIVSGQLLWLTSDWVQDIEAEEGFEEY